MRVRAVLWGVVVIGVVMLAASCMGFGSSTPASSAPQMGGPAFNNAGDNGPMVLLTVIVVVVLFAAGALALSVFREWRDDRAVLRAEMQRLRGGELSGEQQSSALLNGHPYQYRPVDYRSGRRQIRR